MPSMPTLKSNFERQFLTALRGALKQELDALVTLLRLRFENLVDELETSLQIPTVSADERDRLREVAADTGLLVEPSEFHCARLESVLQCHEKIVGKQETLLQELQGLVTPRSANSKEASGKVWPSTAATPASPLTPRGAEGVATPRDVEAKVKKLFDDLDTDGSGWVSKDELRVMFEANLNLFSGRTPRNVKKIVDDRFAKADMDGNGQLTFPEVLKMVQEIQRTTEQENNPGATADKPAEKVQGVAESEPQQAVESSESGVAGKKMKTAVFLERLRLERHMRNIAKPFIGTLICCLMFFSSLLYEVKYYEMENIKGNLWRNFNLDAVADIKSYSEMYSYLYEFMDAAERFDPLDRARYVARRYGPPSDMSQIFETSVEDVTVIQEKKFFAISALLLRPQVLMSRSERVACKNFATLYDRIYSMSRYLKYKFRGVIEGGWQPIRVWFQDGHHNSPSGVISERTKGVQPVAQLSSNATSDMGSNLLICTDRMRSDKTMLEKLKTKYGNVNIQRGGRTYIGDLLSEQTDILAYMGYNVYDPDPETHPDCFTTNRRNETSGAILPNGTKVSIDDVHERCEETEDRWHDKQTDRVMTQVILYTPVVDIFTSLQVVIDIDQTGLFMSRVYLNSFQFLRKAPGFNMWLAMTGGQLAWCALQVVLLFGELRHQRINLRKFPTQRAQVREGRGTIIFTIMCQTLFIIYLSWRLLHELTRTDLWELFEKLLSTNPYSEDGMRSYQDTYEAIDSEMGTYKIVKICAFLAIMIVAAQTMMCMKAHPRLALMTSILALIAQDVLHWAFLFCILYLILCITGVFAFGAHIKAFATLRSTLILGVDGLLGNWEFGSLLSELPEATDQALFVVWQTIFLFTMFLFLLNFFLAIVVDGFTAVKDDLRHDEARNSFFTDVRQLVWVQMQYKYQGWPTRLRMLEVLEDLAEKKKKLSVKDLCESGLFDSVTDGEQRASQLINTYIGMLPAMEFKIQEKRPSSRQESFLESIDDPQQLLLNLQGLLKI